MSIYFGQDIDEKLSQAETFFDSSNHIRAYDWAQYSDTEKKAGLNQSEREIDSRLGGDMEDLYSTTDWPMDYYKNFRPDYAVMEQAFFLLENTARTNTATDGKHMIQTEEYQREGKQTGVTISPDAQRWLKLNRVRIEMG